jgi:hypothetical protein
MSRISDLLVMALLGAICGACILWLLIHEGVVIVG